MKFLLRAATAASAVDELANFNRAPTRAQPLCDTDTIEAAKSERLAVVRVGQQQAAAVLSSSPLQSARAAVAWDWE